MARAEDDRRYPVPVLQISFAWVLGIFEGWLNSKMLTGNLPNPRGKSNREGRVPPLLRGKKNGFSRRATNDVACELWLF